MKRKIYIILISFLFHISIGQVNFQWVKQLGGNYSIGYSVTNDLIGNVYSTGLFQGTVDFDPGIGVFNLTSNGSSDVYIQKLDQAGNLIWAKYFGGISVDEGYDITVDPAGNVYTTGFFSKVCDFDPGVGVFTITSTGSPANDDVFVSKLDVNGNFVWAKKLGGDQTDNGNSIAVDASGNVYTTGAFGLTADFDPGPSTYTLVSASGNEDVFISKLDNSGNFIWAKRFGKPVWDGGNSVKVDVLKNVYTTGYFTDTVDFDPGPGVYKLFNDFGTVGIFVSKLDSNGNFIWARNFGGTGGNFGHSVAISSLGDVYSTGYFSNVVDFDPGIGTYTLASYGMQDVYVSKLDQSGNFLWAKQMGGPSTDMGNTISVDGSNNVYTTGYFWQSADFDPGPATYSLTTFGFEDVFISKLDALGNFVWAKQVGGKTRDISSGISIDLFGNIYTTGFFQDTCDFDPGPLTYTLVSVSGNDAFVHKLGNGTTNINTLKENSIISAFPNPTTKELHFILENKKVISSIRLISTTGNIVYEKLNLLSDEVIIDISNLASGVYVAELSEGNNISRTKIIKN